MTINRPEFQAHDDFIFEHKEVGKVTREEFIKYIRSSHEHMRKLSEIIQQYNQTIDDYLDEWDGKFESFDEDVKDLLHLWIQDGTMDHIINENLMSTKADKSYVDDLNENVTAQLAQMAIYFDDFGGVGDGVTDNSQLFHDFLALGGNLVIPQGVFMVQAEEYQLTSNTRLLFEEGATVKLLPHSTSRYYMLDFYDTENVTVIHPTLDGSKSNNSATEGEWGHGLNVVNTTNATIIRPTIKNTFGDGIYIGHEYWGESLIETEDITIINPKITDVRRNGISICGGRNITIDEPYIKGVRGTDPKAGIDIEPESMGGGKPFLENVVINNPYIEDAQTGIEYNFTNLINRGLKVDVRINSPVVVNTAHSGFFRQLNGELDGFVEINNPISKNNALGAYIFDRYPSENSPHIRINNPEIYGFDSVLPADNRLNFCFSFSNFGTSDREIDVGNVTIVNPYVETSATDYLRFLYTRIGRLDGNATGRVKNVTIINPELKEGTVLTSIINTPEIKLIDGLNSFHMSPSYFETSLSSTMVTTFDNKNATDWLYLKTTKAGTAKGHRVRINVIKDQRITFNTTTYVLGFTSSGSAKGIYSSEIGASIELEFNGEYWFVLNSHGEWLPET